VRALVQRVSEARTSVEGNAVATIGRGLIALVGIAGEGDDDRAWLALHQPHALSSPPFPTAFLRRSVSTWSSVACDVNRSIQAV
jgi:hypothetical protein